MRELIAAAAGPRRDTETRESWLRRAARMAGVSYRQAKGGYYGEILDPNGKLAAKFRAAAEREGRAGAARLAEQFETVAAQLGAGRDETHPAASRADIAALVRAARALRGLSGAGDHRAEG